MDDYMRAKVSKRGVTAADKRKRGQKRKAATTREEVLEQVRAVVLANAVEMAEAVCEEGKRGSYLHSKFMFEVGSLYPAAPAQETDRKTREAQEAESLAALVLKQLELDEIEKEESAARGGVQEAGTGGIT